MAEGAFLFVGYQIGIQRTLKKIKKAGATSENTAKTAEELGLKKRYLKGLREKGVKETSDGRFYVECEDGKHSKGL